MKLVGFKSKKFSVKLLLEDSEGQRAFVEIYTDGSEGDTPEETALYFETSNLTTAKKANKAFK